MYKNLKKWMNLPLVIKRYDGRDGTGSIVYKTPPTNTTCYIDGKVQVITNSLGVEVVSTRQIYVDGSENVAELDNVIFEGQEIPVKGITTFYRDGKPDLKVVFV